MPTNGIASFARDLNNKKIGKFEYGKNEYLPWKSRISLHCLKKNQQSSLKYKQYCRNVLVYDLIVRWRHDTKRHTIDLLFFQKEEVKTNSKKWCILPFASNEARMSRTNRDQDSTTVNNIVVIIFIKKQKEIYLAFVFTQRSEYDTIQIATCSQSKNISMNFETRKNRSRKREIFYFEAFASDSTSSCE